MSMFRLIMRWMEVIIMMAEAARMAEGREGRLYHGRRNHHHSLLPKAKETRVMEEVLRSYDKRVRPGQEQSTPVTIHMTIVLAILTELRENQQVASIVMSHVQRWRDEKLAWDPDKFNGTTQIILPVSSIWVPKLFIYNSMETKQMLSDEKYDARVSHNGDVKVNNPDFVTVICRLNIDLFPFDTQFCAIAFASPLLNIEEMNVNVSSPPRDSYFTGNAEWEVMNVTAKQMSFLEDGEYRVEVHYILSINRRPIYYVTVIVVPTFLISALSILGIFSPGTNDGPRNEKVSLGLGSLLAMTVLLDIVAGAMPKSNSIPLLGYYIIAEILVCAIAVAVSMALLGASRARIQEERMPTEMAYRLLFISVKQKSLKNTVKCVPCEPPSVIRVESPQKGPVGKEGTADVWQIRQRDRIPELIAIQHQLMDVAHAQRVYRERLEKHQWQAKVEKEWNRIFGRLDHVLLLSFQLLNLLTLLAFLRYAFIPVPTLPDDFAV